MLFSFDNIFLSIPAIFNFKVLNYFQRFYIFRTRFYENMMLLSNIHHSRTPRQSSYRIDSGPGTRLQVWGSGTGPRDTSIWNIHVHAGFYSFILISAAIK